MLAAVDSGVGHELPVAQSIIRDLFVAVVSNKSFHPSATSLQSVESFKVVCIRGRVVEWKGSEELRYYGWRARF